MKMIKEHLKGSSKGARSEKSRFVSPRLGCRENLEPCVLQNPEWKQDGMGAVVEVFWAGIPLWFN